MSATAIVRARIVTAATAGYYRECAERLKAVAGALGHPVEIYDLPERLAGDRSTGWKPAVIRAALARGPCWYMDADDSLTGPLGDPGLAVSFGWTLNPELSVIGTQLWMADCLHWWRPSAVASVFLEYWDRLMPLATNGHRALLMAYYGTGWWYERAGWIAPVTGCVMGRYVMAARGRRPEARL